MREKREKRHAFSEKRFFATCWCCKRRLETDDPKEVRFLCECGEKITWNDAVRLMTVKRWMLFKPDYRVVIK